MKKNSKSTGIWMGFDIFAGRGIFLRPEKIVSWDESKYKGSNPEDPLLFGADALVGLSLVQLNRHLQNPFSTPKMNFSFAAESWKALEPHQELFVRAQPRVQALREATPPKPSAASQKFERQFAEVLDSSLKPWGFDFNRIQDLVASCESLESQIESPLLYNFQLTFSKETLAKMHFLHSLLFNLRALIVMDYNAHIMDPAHEAAKIDSITDYLPKADYVANDALLYWVFKKSADEMPKPTAQKMEQAFFDYLHNGASLIQNLPKSFLKRLNNQQLEESLYLVQMDWLLGTEAGLLFRLREELYGLMEGYEKVFYPDLSDRKAILEGPLSISCHLTEENLFPSSTAA